MRRSRWSRLLAVLASGLLAITLLEPPHLRACPRHDAVAAPTEALAHLHHGGATQTSGLASVPSGDDSGCCTCAGDCVGTAGAAFVIALPSAVVAVSLLGQDPPAVVADAPAARVGLRLPFANGPPVRA